MTAAQLILLILYYWLIAYGVLLACVYACRYDKHEPLRVFVVASVFWPIFLTQLAYFAVKKCRRGARRRRGL